MPVALAHRRAEARCRYYTREEAQRVGWNVRHPSRGGRFLEEQEVVDYFPALRDALGASRPDFGILTRDGLLGAVIECKNDYRSIDTAVSEAVEYANTINQQPDFDVRLAIGIAGTPDKFVQTQVKFRRNGSWQRLSSHGYPLTQIPSLHELETAIQKNDGTTDVQLPTEREFFDAAINISRILRLAKIEEHARAKVIGAIILALYQGDFSLEPATVLEHINANVVAAVDDFQDVDNQRRRFLSNTLQLSTEAHRLRDAIGEVVNHLERLNVRSIMRSGVDFLGKFYETFLRYGCDTKKMGIVFTPRHITRFCAEAVDVRLGMKAYDPASGTGGFLVAAFDRMMQEATTDNARRTVKESIWGCDTDATVWSLAVLNMFFRGDGKSHIHFGSCFDRTEEYAGKFDRALLNPPFSQEGEPETDFIDHALNSLTPGGELAVVVKTSVLVDPSLSQWRRALVENHQIVSVISLPSELFYPTAAPTVILIARAHSPRAGVPTFLARVSNDGYEISKKRRVEAPGSQLPRVLELLRQFRQRGTVDTEPNFVCSVDRELILEGDEICAEKWLPSSQFDVHSFEHHRHEMFRSMSLAVANQPEIIDEVLEGFEEVLESGPRENRPQHRITLDEWFDIKSGASSGSKNYPGGEIPYVSSGDTFNSIVEFVQPPDDEIYDSPHITVTGFGQAYIQPWRFCARGNGGSAVRVLRPKFGMSLAELIWFAGQINAQRWRFNYGRMATQSRLARLELDPPPADLPAVTGLEERLRRFKHGVEQLSDFSPADEPLAERFQRLAAEWKAGRGPYSSARQLADHPAYRQIIEMGEEALPFLLTEVRREPDHWFIALRQITGQDPVPAAQRGRIDHMAAAWVEWGIERGLIEA